MDPKTISLVTKTWQAVAAIGPEAGALFYHNLFEADPQLKPLFRGDIGEQGRKLLLMIGAAVAKLREPQVLVPVLQDLGRRHVHYGVKDAHYMTVGLALLKTLDQGLGDAFTPEVERAWAMVYGVIADTMKTAAKEDGRAVPALQAVA